VDVSAARPDDLEDFSRRSHGADGDLESVLGELKGQYHEFVSENRWGVFEAGSLLGAFGAHLRGNTFTARWVAGIAEAFRRAGGNGALVRLPDKAIKASLRAAGLDHHRRSVTFDAPVAYGFPPTTGYTDDPINTATGNFVTREEDVVCGGLADGLTFARTYNSRSDRVGAFGRGWASWATARLLPRPDGAAYVGPDGQEALFPRMGDGYGRVLGVDALVEPLAWGVALCWFDGRRWEFGDAGLPCSVSRGPGTEIRLRHDDGRLVELAHAGGRRVGVEWDAGGSRIVRLACSDGRCVSYRYDESEALVEVDGAGAGAGGTRCYELDDAGRVVSVTDGDGVVEAVNSYDEDGRVLEQLSPFGRRTYLSYLPGRVTVTTDDDEHGPVNTFIHDAAGRLLAVVDGDDRQLSVAYDEWGNPVAVTERTGAVTVQAFDDRSRLVRRVLPSGATYSFAYDDADRLVEVAVSCGGVTRYGYAGDERIPCEITDPEGGVTRQAVRDGLVRRIVDPDGVTVEYEYDADGDVVAATDGDGATERLERDAAGRVTAEVTPLGRRVALSYDGRGRIVERHVADGGVWRYEYTAGGRLAAVADPCGGREETRYGDHGRPVATVDPLGHVTGREYDAFGNVAGLVEPGGARWRYTYDAVMRPVATIDPLGGRWEREYDVNGTLVATIDPEGVRMSASTDAFGRVVAMGDGLTEERFELDELGRVVALCRADGATARAEYDLCGRRTLFENASGDVTRWEYTPGGRVAREISPSGRIEAFEYDARGRVAARIDGAGRRWDYRYDADGAPVETRLPTGEAERWVYDGAGRLTQRSAPGDGVTRYEYDAVGRIVAIADREAGARRFEYDASGRLARAVDANGGVTHYAYDERGRPTQITDPLGDCVTRRYDAVGRLVQVTDQLGRSGTAAYDLAGRLIERADAAGRKVRRSYDAAGRLMSFGPADAEPTTIEYDALGRMVAVDEPGSFSHRLRWDPEDRLVERRRDDLAMRWAYKGDGEWSALGYPDGTETRYVHDAGGYVVAAEHPALGSIELRRDAAGRLVGASAGGMQASWRYADGDLVAYEMHAGGTSRTARLTRDAVGRVVQATFDGAVNEFAYDAAGQLLSATGPRGAFSFGYDANGRLARETSPSGTVEYEHDRAGELVRRATGADTITRFEYDPAGYRVRETGPDLERRYRWDALGRLREIERAGRNGAMSRSIDVAVDALGELAAIDGTSTLWDTAHPLQPLTWTGSDAVIGEGAPWALASAGSAHWLAPDWQGTIGDAPRDPWGARPDAATLVDHSELGYRGELEFDAETWLRHRVYQPASRCFSQPDPLAPVAGTASAANQYHYAANNPIGRSDPLGLRPLTDRDLQALRDRMDRNLLEKGRDYTVDHAGDISAITGLASVVALGTPLAPLAPGLALISAATGGVSVYQSYKGRDYAGMALDVAGVAMAGTGAVQGLRVAGARRALKATRAQADQALAGARAAAHINLAPLADIRYARQAELGQLSAQRGRAAHTLERSERNLNYQGAYLGVLSMARSHLRDSTGVEAPPQAPYGPRTDAR
jgi:RHS repeat-associated protein